MCKNAHPAHDPSSENNVIDIFMHTDIYQTTIYMI